MKNSKIHAAILFVSGLIAVIVGIGMVFFPAEFHASTDIVLDGNVNLTNEMRAAGGPPLIGGIVIILGAFYEPLRFTATLIASVFYLSYGVARIISIVMDGMPSTSLTQVAILEIAIGLICTGALILYSKQKLRSLNYDVT